MSVIIRLQNLPWSANATDIRTYFTGLSIPEGGVHIVGGEQGDAFIAFSTDEDARQAMLRDGGKLKEVKIKLYLSSRTEMLRIIEQARQQSLNLQNIMHVPPVSHPVPTPQVVVPTMSYETTEIKDSSKEEDSDRGRDDDDHKDRRDRRDRESSISRDRGRSTDKDRLRNDRDRDRSRHNRDRDRDRRRRERSKSRDRYRGRRSRSRDRNRRSSRDKDGKNKRRDSELEHDEKSSSIPKEQSTSINNTLWDPPMQPKPALLPDPILPHVMSQMQGSKEMTPPQQSMLGFHDQDRRPMGFPQMTQGMAYPGMSAGRGREGWGPMNNMPTMPMTMMGTDGPRMPMNRHPVQMQKMSVPDMQMVKYPPASYSTLPQQFHSSMKDPHDSMGNKHWANTSISQNASDAESDVCIEIHGLPLNATYVDVKRLFDGLTIPPDGIKMINDNHGNRTGIAYVKFTQPHHKQLALNQNGKKVRSSIVEVLHLRESIYNKAVDNFKPEKDVTIKSDDMDLDNSDNLDDSGWERQGDSKKMNYHDPRMANKNGTNKKKNDTSVRKEKSKVDCVVVKGLPHHTTERDILDFFADIKLVPSQIQIVCDNNGKQVGDAFCRFESSEIAEKAATKNKGTLGRSTVSVFVVQREEMERAKNFSHEPYMPPYRPPFMPMRGHLAYNPRMSGEGFFMEGERPRMGFGDQRWMGENMMERPMMGRGDMPMRGRGRMMMGGEHRMPHHMPMMRPPRRAPPNRSSSPYIDGDSLENFGKPGCVVAMENIHFKADIDEIMEFFEGFEIEHEDVIRRFDESGRPTGDARVALKSPSDANRAVRSLNFKQIRGRSIKLSIV